MKSFTHLARTLKLSLSLSARFRPSISLPSIYNTYIVRSADFDPSRSFTSLASRSFVSRTCWPENWWCVRWTIEISVGCNTRSMYVWSLDRCLHFVYFASIIYNSVVFQLLLGRPPTWRCPLPYATTTTWCRSPQGPCWLFSDSAICHLRTVWWLSGMVSKEWHLLGWTNKTKYFNI